MPNLFLWTKKGGQDKIIAAKRSTSKIAILSRLRRDERIKVSFDDIFNNEREYDENHSRISRVRHEGQCC